MAMKKVEREDPKGDDFELDHRTTLKKLRTVIRAIRRHSTWIEKKCGVSGSQLWIMQELHETPGLRVGEIAEKLAIHQITASSLLDGLEKRGYVMKMRDADDPDNQKTVKLALSENGADLLAGAPKPARGLLPQSLRQLRPEQLARLAQGLDEC